MLPLMPELQQYLVPLLSGMWLWQCAYPIVTQNTGWIILRTKRSGRLAIPYACSGGIIFSTDQNKEDMGRLPAPADACLLSSLCLCFDVLL